MDESKKIAYKAGAGCSFIAAFFIIWAINLGWNIIGESWGLIGLFFGGLGIGSFWKPEFIGRIASDMLENMAENSERRKKNQKINQVIHNYGTMTNAVDSQNTSTNIDTPKPDRARERLEQEQDERREELKGYIHEHNQKLIESVIKDWYDKRKLINSSKQKLAIEHLKIGYYNIWKLQFEECKALRNQISKEEKKIKEYVKNKSYSELENIFNDEYLSQEEITESVHLIKESELIYELLDEFEKTGKIKNMIENSQEIIETIIKDKPLHEMFKKVIETKKSLNEKINKFEQCLDKIAYDFEERHVELKGTCKDCKDWHDELESFK